jgi:hypothetical protein
MSRVSNRNVLRTKLDISSILRRKTLVDGEYTSELIFAGPAFDWFSVEEFAAGGTVIFIFVVGGRANRCDIF